MRAFIVVAAFASSVAFAGCAHSETSQSSATPAPTDPPIVAQALAEEADLLKAAGAAAGPMSTAEPDATPIAGIGSGPHAITIQTEITLGIIDDTNGTFVPDATISRGRFMHWLVRANNVYFAGEPAKQIAVHTRQVAFNDVPAGSAYYNDVQGFVDAGYRVAASGGTFAPDRALTRGDMAAILGARDPATVTPVNLGRIFGAPQLGDPAQPVTQAEAAEAVGAMDDHGLPLPQPT
jgi:hypothetical protein